MDEDRHRPLSIRLLRQKQNVTVADVYDGNGKRVGTIREPRFLTSEECMVAARVFRDEHPELFPIPNHE